MQALMFIQALHVCPFVLAPFVPVPLIVVFVHALLVFVRDFVRAMFVFAFVRAPFVFALVLAYAPLMFELACVGVGVGVRARTCSCSCMCAHLFAFARVPLASTLTYASGAPPYDPLVVTRGAALRASLHAAHHTNLLDLSMRWIPPSVRLSSHPV